MNQAQALAQIRNTVGDAGFIDRAADMAPYLEERRGLFHTQALAVVRPANTDEVAAVVRYCRAARIAIVPQGGRTGLCGGAVPTESVAGGPPNQIILNLSRMNRIREVNPLAGVITVEAGCILAAVQQAAQAVDALFPLSLASEGSCQIGGVLATNAGGHNVLRYGNAQDLVLGLEVVLVDGRIWNGLRALPKDNAGYHLKSLFLGSEGTLGIITAAVLKFFPKPQDVATAVLALPNVAIAPRLLRDLRIASGESVTACELMGRTAFSMSLEYLGETDPFDKSHDWYLLVELASSRPDGGLTEVLQTTLNRFLAAGDVQDALLAASQMQRLAFWRWRESIPDAQRQVGASIKHDVSVPVDRVAEFIEQATACVLAADARVRVCAFGHVGDGNIHFNLTQPEGMAAAEFLQQWGLYNQRVFDLVADYQGSIAAEHGVGQLKVKDLRHYSSPEALALMTAVKQALDPEDLLNPGKVVSQR